MYRKAYEGYRGALGSTHEDTLNSAFLLGGFLFNQDLFAEATSMYQKAYDEYKKTPGHSHTTTLKVGSLLAQSQYKQMQYGAAVKYTTKSTKRERRYQGLTTQRVR
jgi:tetratricopeptide (TPR) repeat protein